MLFITFDALCDLSLTITRNLRGLYKETKQVVNYVIYASALQ